MIAEDRSGATAAVVPDGSSPAPPRTAGEGARSRTGHPLLTLHFLKVRSVVCVIVWPDDGTRSQSPDYGC